LCRLSSAPARARFSIARLFTHLGSTRSEEVEQVAERPARLAHLDHVAHGLQPDVADGAQRVEHRPVLHGEVGLAGVHVGRTHRHAAAAGVLVEDGQLVAVGSSRLIDPARNSTGVVRLQVPRLVGDRA
jgi:hypothetical protein